MRRGMNGRTLQHESEYVHQLGASSSMQSVKLISIATAVPPHAIEQGDAATAAHHRFGGRVSDFNRLARVSVPTTRSVRELHCWLCSYHWAAEGNLFCLIKKKMCLVRE
jgi:hypothetical protein